MQWLERLEQLLNALLPNAGIVGIKVGGDITWNGMRQFRIKTGMPADIGGWVRIYRQHASDPVCLSEVLCNFVTPPLQVGLLAAVCRMFGPSIQIELLCNDDGKPRLS